MSDTAQLVKDKLDIVDFLRQYVELKPSGKNFKARCPFHKEKTPSFMVSPERQSWHCFGSCSEGGDIIKFLMKYENLEFYDALKILAEKTGVEISAGNRDFQANNNLYAVMNAAKEFYKSNLTRSDLVKGYLKERGLKEEIVQEFELGLAPDGSDVLTRHLLKLGYNILDIEKAGLALKTERGTYWDRFRSRVMFPIYNQVGKVVAFTGRILPGSDTGNVGKYVNSPETPIFQKSKILYGFHETKNAIRETKQAVVVEGQMDFLMAWQDGVKNAVASSGTALTPDHLTILRRLADELVLSFDADEAGQLAAERSIDLAGQQDFLVKLLIIEGPEVKDPADVVRKQPGRIKKLVEQSKSAMEYYLHRYIKDLPSDQKLKKQNLRTMLSKIKSLASPIDQNYWLKELSGMVNIEERILAEEMGMLKEASLAARPESAGLEKPVPKLSRRDLISERLLGLLFHLKNDLNELTEHLSYLPKPYFQVYETFAKQNNLELPGDLSELMANVSLRFSFDNQNLNPADLEKETKNLLRELKVEYLKEKRQEISDLIRKLEKAGDENSLKEALREFAVISKELQNV
ncbi:MAG: DNA primase [Candidatus Harrisonbacteria bacterium]|nr:DNA primase [Candidatus Harrisonbacteria bacterium]